MPEPDRSPPRSPLLRVAIPGYRCPSRTDSLILTQSDQRFSFVPAEILAATQGPRPTASICISLYLGVWKYKESNQL